MWEKYKQNWIKNINKEIGDRSAIQAVFFYIYIFFGSLGIFFGGFIALIFVGLFLVFLHVFSAEQAGEIIGIIFLGLPLLMLIFSGTEKGNRFFTCIGEKIEGFILSTFLFFRVLLVFCILQNVAFLVTDEAAGSFISSAPFVPPRCLS